MLLTTALSLRPLKGKLCGFSSSSNILYLIIDICTLCQQHIDVQTPLSVILCLHRPDCTFDKYVCSRFILRQRSLRSSETICPASRVIVSIKKSLVDSVVTVGV